MRSNRFQFDHHIRDGVLDLWVIRHGTRHTQRAFFLCRVNRHVQGTLRQAVIDIAESHQRPGKDSEYETIYSGAASRNDACDITSWDEHIFENCVVAAGRAHTEDVPGFLDDVSGRIARHEGVNNFRLGWVAGIHSVDSEASPHWGQAAKVLAAAKAIAAFDAFCFRRGEENRYVVTGFRMTSSEDFAGGSVTQQPFQRTISTSPQIGGDPD